MKNFKSGVSLVTVLLFMLVATIAATATYKWLTSEGRSSASRMMEAEAKQAAVAGIESARSWMTYHGNEVGAIVKQFFANDKKPIKLDRVLSSGLEGHQDYSVSVVGIDARTNVYKIKVLSQGTSRNGTKHTEAAIMKVTGLYRVMIPTEEEEVVADLDYNFGYVGGGTSLDNNNDGGAGAASMLVYGDLKGKELYASSDLIVTGNLGDDNTNNIYVGGRTCVGGNLEFKQEGFRSAHDLYVRHNAKLAMKSGVELGNAYFGGNVGFTNLGGNITIGGDVTLKGRWESSTAKKTHIKGKMCLGPTAVIDFQNPSNSNQGAFTLDGSMWAPNQNALQGSQVGNYNYVVLGSNASSELYIQNAYKCDSKYRSGSTGSFHTSPTTNYYSDYGAYGWKPYSCTSCPEKFYFQGRDRTSYDIYFGDNCGSGKNFCEQQRTAYRYTSYGAFTSEVPSENIHADASGTPSVTCDEGIKTYCETYFNQATKKCGTKDAIADLLQTAVSSFGSKTTTCVENLKKQTKDQMNNGEGIKSLNICYTSATASEKYNGYLVVKAKAKWMNDLFANASATLSGKYIFYVDEPPYGLSKLNGVKLPPTTTDTYVFMYLPNGAGSIDQNNGSKFNYFIYSEKDIASVGSTGGAWTGSFYLSSKNCAKVGTFSTGNATNLVFDPTFLNDLVSSKIICPASATSCGTSGGVSSSTETSSSTLEEGGYDNHHIATGPQLHIEVESEYSNSESVGSSDDVEKSILVLPRVVYVNANSSGKLTDYITVLPLNGASIAKNGNKVAMSGITSCKNGGPSATTSLSSQSSVLQVGKHYECSYTEGTYESVFHIFVTEGSASTPSAYLEPPAMVPITGSSTSNNTVNLVIPAFSGDAQNFSLEIRVIDNHLSGWTVKDEPSNVTEKSGSGGTIYTYNGTTSSTRQTVPVFTVSTAANSQAGSVIFALQSPSNCSVTNNATKTYSITGSASIERRSIKEYCSKYSQNCTGDGVIYKDAEDEEDCEFNGTWVDAGPNCVPEEGGANNKWKCASGNSSNNPIHLESRYNGTQCILYIPSENNYIVGAKDDSENSEKPYILYASLKKKKFPLKVFKESDVASGVDVKVYTRPDAESSYELFDNCSALECDYSIVFGTHVKLEPDPSGDNKFNYWACNGAQCEWVNNIAHDLEFTMDRDRSYTAHFNERDDHCFYSVFDTMTVSCDRVSTSEKNRHCIDECKANANSCHVGSGIYGDYAKWLRVYSDNPNLPSTESGFLRNPRGNKVSFIMHRNVAGPNGMLTARIKTPKIASGHESDILNDGFVVRANKSLSEYLMVNIYGVSDAAFARVCLASGLSTSSGKCVKQRLVNSYGNSFIVSPTEEMNVKLTLDRSDLTVEVKKNSGTFSRVFDLASDWNNGTLNDDGHQYVGFKLSNSEFQIHDIGWKADVFSNAGCFDYPSISCSFAAQYIGGQVPLRTEVEPWVGYSSWFEHPENCSVGAYYYNGCDMPSSYFYNWGTGNLVGSCQTESKEGYYNKSNDKKDGIKLNDKFYFNDKDQHEHGYLHADGNGYVRNASVSATCPNTENTSLDLFANCGRFYVGELKECTKNESILTSSSSMGTSEATIQKTDVVFNLRNSKLNFDFTGLSDGGDIKVVLVDENEISSPVRYISNSNKSIDVDEFLNQHGFNPERVKKILMTGSSNYTLNAISSTCPNAVTINCVSAEFDKVSEKKWVVNTTIGHVENAKKCKITANSTDIAVPSEFVSCNATGVFMVNDNELKPFENHLHTGSSKLSYEFTVGVYDDDKAKFTDEPTVSCSIETEEYEKVGVTCDIGETASVSVIQGLGVPKLNYTFTRCPSYGCYYSITLTSDIKNIGYGEGATAVSDDSYSWQPADANKATRFSTGGYRYTVSATDEDGNEYASCQTDEFTVVKAVEATASCSISNGILSISATASNYEDVPVKVAMNSVFGNPLWETTLSVSGTGASHTINLNSDNIVEEGQKVVLAIKLGTADPQSCGEYTRPVGEPSGTCSVDKSAMYSDDVQKATFSVTDVTHCNSWALEKEGVTDPVSSGSTATSISVGNLGPGTYNLYFNGSETAYCTKTITEKTHASLSCSSIAIEEQTAASSVEITIPYGNLTVGGCDGNGCSYTVAATTTGATVSNATGNFTGGDISFNATNPSGEIGYSLTLTDDGEHTTDACTFSVTFNEEEPTECQCETYCGAGCKDNIITGNVSNGNFTGCVFFTSATRINVNAGDSWTINNWHENIKPSDNGCWNNSTNCENFLTGKNIDKADGGYYFKGSGIWVELQTTGTDPCGGSGGGPSGSGTADDPYDDGSIGNYEHKDNYAANTWYSVTTASGTFVVQNHTNAAQPFTYKDCNGSEHTATLSKGNEGNPNCGGGYWNCFENVSNGCTIKFKFNNAGEYDLRAW